MRPSLDQLTRWRKGRRPRGFSRPAACAIAAVGAVLVLAACGSSGSSTTTGSVTAAASDLGTTTQATSTAPASKPETTTQASPPAAPALKVAGCRSVPAPASRAGEEASKPTGQLDPARSYTVRLTTNCGPIVIQLAVKEAPKIAETFAHLVQVGYYDELTFHRVVAGFVIQGGDPNGNGTGGPTWKVVEPPPANLRYTKGVVAMAKSGTAPAGAAGSQFFIVTGSSTNLPPVYALVGRVVSGERSVEAISRVPTEAASEKPRIPIVIERATLSIH